MRKRIFTKGLIFGIIILFQGVCIPYSIHANQGQVLFLTDFTNDVLDATTGKMVSRPNIDIYKVSASQEGIVIELKLQLLDGGEIQNNLHIYYEIDLTTDLHSYMAFFGGGEIGVTDENDTDIDIINYSGIETNELSILFNLYSSDEGCLNLSAATFEFSSETEEGYYDECPNQGYMTIIVDNMVEEVLVYEMTPCWWQNASSTITINVYGDSADNHMNVSIEITGCGFDISINEEDAMEDGYWISDGVYEVEISPKIAGTITITVTNDTEGKTVSKDFSVRGLYGSVTTSVENDKEIFINSTEKIKITIVNGQYAEVHVTYFNEGWLFISCLNDTIGDNTAGNGLNGIFEFDITQDDIYEGVGYIVVAASAGANYMFDIIEVVLSHPYKPQTPTGKKIGKIGQNYSYSTKSIDPEAGQVYYMWDWGDGNFSEWLGPYDSGVVVNAENIWSGKGTYEIKVKAKNIYNRESSWSDPLLVKMPRSRVIDNLVLRLFENQPLLYKIFQFIFKNLQV
jgi:hypothetical protein